MFCIVESYHYTCRLQTSNMFRCANYCYAISSLVYKLNKTNCRRRATLTLFICVIMNHPHEVPIFICSGCIYTYESKCIFAGSSTYKNSTQEHLFLKALRLQVHKCLYISTIIRHGGRWSQNILLARLLIS
jgi:hypothetical protein